MRTEMTTRTELSSAKIPRLLRYLARTALYAGIIALLDIAGLFIATGTIRETTLTLLLFLEGGLGLLLAAAIALSSGPSISKVGETLLGSAPFSMDSQSHAERVSVRWMMASAILVGIGFIVSAV